MRVNPKYIQLVGDAIIPILGFFLWDWNLYFILLFYFLDMLTKEVLLHLKSNKISIYKKEINFDLFLKEKKQRLKYGIISFILLFFSVVLVQLAMPFVQSDFNAKEQIISFWSYKDMGIEQGYILVPLVIFMGYSQYKMEFLAPSIFTKLSMQNLWLPHLRSMLVLMSLTALSFVLVSLKSFPEWFFVVSIVVLSSIYQLIVLKKNEREISE
jgi:hypothetical protein